MPSPLPDLFVERFRQIVPAHQVDAALASFATVKPTTFRVNTLKTAPSQLRTELTAQGFNLQSFPEYDTVFSVAPEQRRALTETPAFYEGRLYIQNLSSILASLILDPQPDEMVLDLAAAPGGKSTHIAALMQNRGQLSAVESVRGRFFKLLKNLETQGVTIARTFLMDGRAVGKKCPAWFDRVLLDAPCSSEARFTQHDPQSWAHWNLRKIKEVARKQKRLLRAAVQSLKPDGTLVYCTCSFAPEENEQIVQSALNTFDETLCIEPIPFPFPNQQRGLTGWQNKTFHPDLAHALRILPTDQMDGLFVCKLRKIG